MGESSLCDSWHRVAFQSYLHQLLAQFTLMQISAYVMHKNLAVRKIMEAMHIFGIQGY